MARKPQKKSSKGTWKCKHGCVVTAWPCRHLEALLPKASIKVQVKLSYWADVETLKQNVSQSYDDMIYTSKPNELPDFTDMLKKLGMKHFQIELLVDRFVYNMTFHEILKKNHWTSMGMLYRNYQKCLATLKERGINLRSSSFERVAP